MAKFETVPIGELKHRLPAKLLPLVEEYRAKLEKLTAEQGGRLTREEGRRREGAPPRPKGGGRGCESARAVPLPGRGGVAQLLSGSPAGTPTRAAAKGSGGSWGSAQAKTGAAEGRAEVTGDLLWPFLIVAPS